MNFPLFMCIIIRSWRKKSTPFCIKIYCFFTDIFPNFLRREKNVVK